MAYRRLVQRKSFWGTVSCREPPTKAPFSIRHIRVVSPSHPRKFLPLKREVGLGADIKPAHVMERKANKRIFFIVQKVNYK